MWFMRDDRSDEADILTAEDDSMIVPMSQSGARPGRTRTAHKYDVSASRSALHHSKRHQAESPCRNAQCPIRSRTRSPAQGRGQCKNPNCHKNASHGNGEHISGVATPSCQQRRSRSAEHAPVVCGVPKRALTSSEQCLAKCSRFPGDGHAQQQHGLRGTETTYVNVGLRSSFNDLATARYTESYRPTLRPLGDKRLHASIENVLRRGQRDDPALQALNPRPLVEQQFRSSIENVLRHSLRDVSGSCENFLPSYSNPWGENAVPRPGQALRRSLQDMSSSHEDVFQPHLYARNDDRATSSGNLSEIHRAPRRCSEVSQRIASKTSGSRENVFFQQANPWGDRNNQAKRSEENIPRRSMRDVCVSNENLSRATSGIWGDEVRAKRDVDRRSSRDASPMQGSVFMQQLHPWGDGDKATPEKKPDASISSENLHHQKRNLSGQEPVRRASDVIHKNPFSHRQPSLRESMKSAESPWGDKVTRKSYNPPTRPLPWGHNMDSADDTGSRFGSKNGSISTENLIPPSPSPWVMGKESRKPSSAAQRSSRPASRESAFHQRVATDNPVQTPVRPPPRPPARPPALPPALPPANSRRTSRDVSVSTEDLESSTRAGPWGPKVTRRANDALPSPPLELSASGLNSSQQYLWVTNDLDRRTSENNFPRQSSIRDGACQNPRPWTDAASRENIFQPWGDKNPAKKQRASENAFRHNLKDGSRPRGEHVPEPTWPVLERPPERERAPSFRRQLSQLPAPVPPVPQVPDRAPPLPPVDYDLKDDPAPRAARSHHARPGDKRKHSKLASDAAEGEGLGLGLGGMLEGALRSCGDCSGCTHCAPDAYYTCIQPDCPLAPAPVGAACEPCDTVEPRAPDEQPFEPVVTCIPCLLEAAAEAPVADQQCGGAMWNVDAALAALSLAASFGNLVRLPRLVFLYGGGSFLAVYCATTLLLGLPLALLEVGLGQLCEQGATRVWRAVPLFTGVGIVKVALSALLAIYSPVLMALSLFYAVWSAKGPLPFRECKYQLHGDGYVYTLTSGETCLKNTFLKSPVEDPMWYSVTATFLFLLWTIALLCVFRGSRGYRRVLSVLTVALISGLIAILVDSVKQPGAEMGLQQLLRFDWDALLNVETWYFAVIQMFFSTHIGLGNIVTGAGRFYSKSNAVWTSVAIVLCSLFVSILWVTIVFLRLGRLTAAGFALPAPDIPETLVLTLLYDAAARGNSDPIIASVGFLVIVCAGFSSMVPLLETVLAAVSVESKRRWEWWKTAAVCCIGGFVLGALCLLPERLSLVHVMDHYVVGRLALACTVTELVAFVWIYGCGLLYTDLEFVVGHRLSPYWKILWCLAPLYLLGMEAWSVAVLPWDGVPQSHDPAWQVLLGWGLYFAGWTIICVAALRQVCIQVDYNICQKFLSAVKPSRKWGPADPIYRHCWIQWRDATPSDKMDHTLRRRGTRDYTHSVRMATAPDPLAHFSHLSPSRGPGPFLINSKAELAEHVCWRKEVHGKEVH